MNLYTNDNFSSSEIIYENRNATSFLDFHLFDLYRRNNSYVSVLKQYHKSNVQYDNLILNCYHKSF